MEVLGCLSKQTYQQIYRALEWVKTVDPADLSTINKKVILPTTLYQ